MPDVPVALSGAVTVALIIVLGIFVYPAVLHRPAGKAFVAAATVLLAGLFFVFEGGSGLSTGGQAVAALVIAALPLLAGWIVHRLLGGKRD